MPRRTNGILFDNDYFIIRTAYIIALKPGNWVTERERERVQELVRELGGLRPTVNLNNIFYKGLTINDD